MKPFVARYLFASSLILIATGVAYSGPLATSSPAPAPAQQEQDSQLFRQNVFKALFSDKYFKNATCREFANYNLSRNGLPKIGEVQSVRGTRLTTDRRAEDSDPPLLTDSVLKSEEPYDSYKLSTSGSKNSWTMAVDRELAVSKTDPNHLKTHTVYHFQILDFENKGSCAVINFDFQANHGNAAPIKKSMSLDSCMDLFIADKASLKGPSQAELQAMKILHEDCSIGMHYSLDAKKILAQPKH